MAYPADLSRPVVLRARRDTIVLVAAVTTVTFALASGIHSRAPQQQGTVPQEHWTGGLTDLDSVEAPSAPVEPLTSASLVVPASALTLPQVPMRALVKLRGCDGEACPPPRVSVPTPVRRPGTGLETATQRRTPSRRAKPSLIARLNPFNHLPDMSRISQPFAVAGDTVSSWFRRF